MKRVEGSIILGVVLVAAGLLFLLENIGVFGPIAGIFWALIFAACGVVFLAGFVNNRAHWWALIPGFILLSLGALIGLNELAPALGTTWGGALFLGGMGLGFGAVYLTGRERWWAIIPFGTMITLAVIAGLSESTPGTDLGWMLFLGLALTFGAVYLLPGPGGRMRWAIYPAAVLLVMALLVMASMSNVISFLWPAALILAGLFLAYRALRPQHEHAS